MPTKTPKGRGLGWVPSLPDKRDEAFAYTFPQGVVVPPEVDHRTSFLPTILDQGALGSCFMIGTLILLEDGTELPIEDIGVGQYVQTHTNEAKQVTKVYERRFTGENITLQIKGWDYPLTMTDEHPVAVMGSMQYNSSYGYDRYVESGLVWKQAKDIAPGDFVLMPYGVQERHRNLRLDVRNYIAPSIWTDDNTCRVLGVSVKNSIPTHIVVNEQFAQLVGLFLAEGSFGKSIGGVPNRLVWTFARHEKEYQQFVLQSLSDIFNVEAYAVESDRKPSVTTIRCDNSTLACFFHTFCGESAYYKQVNPVFFSATREIKLALLRGWLMGDGTQNPVRSYAHAGKDNKTVQIEGVTSSAMLHRGMFRLALSCGIRPGARVNKQQAHQRMEPRSLLFYGKSVLEIFPEHSTAVADSGVVFAERMPAHRPCEFGFASKVMGVTREVVEDVLVYNLEVEDVHTYVANGVAVHNCTSFAGKYGLQYTDYFNSKEPDPISELFEYYQERVIEHSTSYDSGANMRDVFKVMKKYGCAPETLWPYDITKFAEKPPAKAYTAAKKDKIKSYHKVQQTRSLLQACLAAKNIFLIGISVYDSFESDAVAKTGIVPMPNLDTENLLGGHAVCCVGFSTQHEWYIFLNSWGDQWGDLKNFPGCFYLPYQYVEDSNLSGDIYTITSL